MCTYSNVSTASAVVDCTSGLPWQWILTCLRLVNTLFLFFLIEKSDERLTKR